MDKEQATTFQTLGGNKENAGVCGPEGCSLATHQESTKQTANKVQQRKEKQND